MDFIEIGAGSYGRILYNPNVPSEVAKVHYLSSEEIEYGEKVCAELFRKEFDFHSLIYNKSKQLHLPVKIPKPILYEYITRNNQSFRNLSNSSDSCVYFMEKLDYPDISTLNQIISPEHIERFIKTNPIIHPPPYLLFCATSDSSFQPGRIHLTDLIGISHDYSIFYSIHNPTVYQIAESMITAFFSLTVNLELILQDIEFVLTTSSVAIIDFNQVIDMETRETIAKPRFPEYTRDFDIANTYLFLSGIDTGFFMTDRNTQWKFLPTPNILPNVFFTTVERLSVKPEIIIGICSKIIEMEMEYISTEKRKRIRKREKEFDEFVNMIQLWHDITIYGMLDTDILDRIDVEYEEADAETISTDIHKFSYFVARDETDKIPVNIVGDFDYYRITKSENKIYTTRFQKKQQCGLISDNWLKTNMPVVYYDIEFQRLFMIQYLFLTIENMNDSQIKNIRKLIIREASFSYMMNWIKSISKIRNNIYNKKYTRKTKKTVNNKTRKTRYPKTIRSQP